MTDIVIILNEKLASNSAEERLNATVQSPRRCYNASNVFQTIIHVDSFAISRGSNQCMMLHIDIFHSETALFKERVCMQDMGIFMAHL